MDAEKIGNFLKSLRISKGLTQQEVADSLFLSPKTISKWESGSGIPDINTITMVADLYGVTVDEILRGEKKKDTKTSQETLTKRVRYHNSMVNNLRKTYDIFDYIACAILVLFVIIGMCFGIGSVAGSIFIALGFIGSLILIIIGNSIVHSSKIILNDDDDTVKEVKKDLKSSIFKRNLIYSSLFLFFVILNVQIILIAYSINDYVYGIVFIVALISVAVIYIIYFQLYYGSPKMLYKINYISMLIMGAALVFCFPTAVLEETDAVSGNISSSLYKMFQGYFIDYTSDHFIFRLIGMIAIITAIVLSIIFIKNKKTYLFHPIIIFITTCFYLLGITDLISQPGYRIYYISFFNGLLPLIVYYGIYAFSIYLYIKQRKLIIHQL